MPGLSSIASPSRQVTARIYSGVVCFLVAIILSACALPQRIVKDLKVTVEVDGSEQTIATQNGYTIQQVLTRAGITLGALDRINPAPYTLITDGMHVQITRVTEQFNVSQVVIPFQKQTLTNESLPSGETRLIQQGESGLYEVTTRILFEDGVETSRHQVKQTVIKEPLSEIMMIGIQEPYTPINIPGRLAYLTSGTGWVMDSSTGIRKPVVSTGDLDGRVFSLSPDGSWLLFTRKSSDGVNINSLWVASVDGDTSLLDLQVNNVIHFADFIPGLQQTIAYSTVEPRSAAPGWQANNDLHQLTFDASGAIITLYDILGPSSGGIYGWWGTSYHWSSRADKILYARPDSIGLVDPYNATVQTLTQVLPYQTNSSWAWIPGSAWDSTGEILYLTIHENTEGMTSGEDSPIFNLSALNSTNGNLVTIAHQTGMFAYPAVSPYQENLGSKLAFLQAVFPDRSDTSTYKLILADQDGSNQQVVFPRAGSTGIEPQTVVWASKAGANGELLLALVYQGNIWLVDANGSSQQITGDGSTSRIDWQ